jgi:hypothetical protein
MPVARPSWIDCTFLGRCFVDDRRRREGGLDDQRRLADTETHGGEQTRHQAGETMHGGSGGISR